MIGNEIELRFRGFAVFPFREKRLLSGGIELPAGEFPEEFPLPFPVPDSNPSGMELKGRSVKRVFGGIRREDVRHTGPAMMPFHFQRRMAHAQTCDGEFHLADKFRPVGEVFQMRKERTGLFPFPLQRLEFRAAEEFQRGGEIFQISALFPQIFSPVVSERFLRIPPEGCFESEGGKKREKSAAEVIFRARRACIICSFRRSRSARRCSRHPCRRVRCSRREWRLCPSLSPFSWRRRLRERIPGRE